MRLLPPRNTPARDVLVAGAGVGGGLLLFAIGTYPLVQGLPYRPPDWLYLVPMAIAGSGLVLRRRAPLACLGVGATAFAADAALGGSIATVLIFTQVLYEACVHGPAATWRWLLRGSLGLTVAGMLVVFVATGGWRQGAWIGVVGTLVLLFPIVTGLSVRQYRDQAQVEHDRAEQTARLAELDRRQAVTSERQRMARELHDVVANHLSAVAIHATAAQAAAGRDEATVRKALAMIRDSGVQGLAEMRRMIRLLRDPERPGEVIARARLAEADRLVEATRQAGLAVRMSVVGEPRPLPVEVDLAAYRILQESLTNALKHGRGGPAHLLVDYRPDRVAVTVENPLPPVTSEQPAAGLPGAGAGLVGMRERAALLHGKLTAGPTDGTWRVYAELPAGGSVTAGGRTKVLVLTTFDLDEYVFGALRAGAAGFLLKDTDASGLIDAVRTVARGDGVIAPALTRRLLAAFAATAAPRPADLLDGLTPRERDVLACLGRGMSNREIADTLQMAEATAKTHTSRVLAKLDLRSRVQAAILAQELGLTG
jgi:signal transduction histidine kinase/DNA-binding NarL/FixJ family response regulator